VGHSRSLPKNPIGPMAIEQLEKDRRMKVKDKCPLSAVIFPQS